MAFYSTQRAVSDGTLVLLPISIEYFDRSEITVYFDDLLVDEGFGWSWVGSTDKTLAFSPAVLDGVEVKVVRTTDISLVRHVFVDGAAFLDETLDENYKQMLHIAQEARERASIADMFSDLNMHGYHIINVGTATEPHHAISLAQYQADALGAFTAKNQAVAAKDAAVVAQVAAELAEAHAELAEVNAETAETNAVTAKNAAVAAQVAAELAETNAELAEVNAETAATSAASSASAAASSAIDAQSSEDAAAAYAASINPANFLQKASNLSDLENTATARTNLGVAIGSNVQAYSTELQAISNGGGNAMFKNRIINGAMMIDQRNAGASVTLTTSSYTLDRWFDVTSVSSKFSVQQSSTAPSGFVNSALLTSLSAYTVGASEAFTISQRIEGYNVADLGWGTASASPVTVSFWVRSSLTGTFGGSVRNSAVDRSYPFSYTISAANTWEQKSITIAGDTTGTWLTTNGVGINLTFGIGVGSSISGTAGAWAAGSYASATGATSVVGTNGATFYITGVQLEKGSTATSFDYRPYGMELALCQRYYYKMFGDRVQGCATTSYTLWNFPVTMRAAPTFTDTYGGFSGSTAYTEYMYIYRVGTYVVVGNPEFNSEL